MINNKVEEIKKHVEAIADILGIEKTESNENTPLRVAKMYCNELFANRNNANLEELNSRMKTFPVDSKYPMPVKVEGIPFSSTCEHHWMPFIGTVDVRYVPSDRIIGLLEAKEEIKSYKLLLNRVRPSLIKSNEMMSVDDVVEILSCPLVGIIPEDTGIITSTNKGEPIVNDENALAGKAYRNVAQRILGEEVPFLDLDEPKGFMAKIKNAFAKLKAKV